MKPIRGLILVLMLLANSQAEARFLTPDPMKPNPNTGQNFNRYWYANNNPIKNVDPDGRWSASAHDKLIKTAYQDRLNAKEIKIIQQSSRDFDKKTQDPSQSHMHAMAQDGQATKAAVSAQEKFVGETMISARGAADAGNRVEALTLLGEAIHPVMDSSSSQHTNTDGSPKEWKGVAGSFLEGQRHSPTDSIGGETTKQLTPEIERSQSGKLNGAYDWIFREGKYDGK